MKIVYWDKTKRFADVEHNTTRTVLNGTDIGQKSQSIVLETSQDLSSTKMCSTELQN